MGGHARKISLALATLCVPAMAAPATAGTLEPARLAYDTHKAERFKTLPIAKNRDGKPRVLFSLGPGRVGDLEAGDVVRAQGEYQATICIKAGSNQPPQPCVGKVYPYNPKLTGRLVLSPSQRARDRRAIPLSGLRALSCSQRIPHRNRHCLLVVHNGHKRLEEPCSGCYLNMIVSASHNRAKKGHKVTMGSFDDNLTIKQNRGGISMVRMRGAPLPDPRTKTQKRRGKIKVANENGNLDRKTIYTMPIRRPRAGDTYYVKSKFTAKIGHLPYNTALQNEILLGKTRESNDPVGLYGITEYPVVSPRNGWTCTRGKSGHRSPCTMRKGGILRFEKDSNDTYHLNLTLSSEAQILEFHNYSGGNVRLGNGFLRVYKFAAG